MTPTKPDPARTFHLDRDRGYVHATCDHCDTLMASWPDDWQQGRAQRAFFEFLPVEVQQAIRGHVCQ